MPSHEPSSFHPPEPAGARALLPGERLAGYAIGTLFAVLGVLVFALTEGWGAGSLIAGLVLLLLGVQALWATSRGRRSWLGRIGPLP